MELTASDGKKYNTPFYNLDAIISVGYRVNSTQATHFCIWATERLEKYIIKGLPWMMMLSGIQQNLLTANMSQKRIMGFVPFASHKLWMGLSFCGIVTG